MNLPKSFFCLPWSLQVNIWMLCLIFVGLALCCVNLFCVTLPCVLQCYFASSSIVLEVSRYYTVSVGLLLLSYAVLCFVELYFNLLRCVTLRWVVLRYVSIFTLFCFTESSTEEISGRMLTPSTPLFAARWRRLLPSTSTPYRKSSTIPWLSAVIRQSGHWIKPTRYQVLVSNRNINKSAITHQIHTLF